MKYRAAFFDVDGVLKIPGPQEDPIKFDKEALGGLYSLKEKGLRIGYISGKSAEYVRECAKLSGIYDKNDIYAGENGGVIIISDFIFEYNKQKEDIEKARKKLEKNKMNGIYEIKLNGYNIPLKEEDKKASITLLFDPEISRMYKDFQDEFRRYFKDLERSLDFVFGDGYVDIIQKGCNKGYATLYICESLGLNSDEVIAVGDGENDIPMLYIAGFPACPSNSKDDVKAIVINRKGYVARNPVGKGTREICEYILENR